MSNTTPPQVPEYGAPVPPPPPAYGAPPPPPGYGQQPGFPQPPMQQPPVKAKKSIFKRWWFWVAAVVVVIIVASIAGGAGTTNKPVGLTDKPAPAASSSASPSPSDSSSSDDSTPTPAPADRAIIGSTIDLKGNTDGEEIHVTLVKIVVTDKPSNEFDGPSQGNRWVSIQWRIKNVGTETYDDSPSNGSTVSNSADESYDSTIVIGTRAGAQFSDNLKIAPGHSGLGYITYEVPKKAKIVSAQFGEDSGFGDSGEWLLHH